MNIDRRQAIKFLASGLATGLLLGCIEKAPEYDPAMSEELNKLVLQAHDTIAELALNETLKQTGGAAGMKQINGVFFVSESTFFAEKAEIGCKQPTIVTYLETSSNFRDSSNPILRKPTTPTFGMGSIVNTLAERGYVQRSYLEDFLFQIDTDNASLMFYTFSGVGFKVDLENHDCVMFRTQVDRQESFDMNIHTQTAGYSFEAESAMELNDISFYNKCLSKLYKN